MACPPIAVIVGRVVGVRAATICNNETMTNNSGVSAVIFLVFGMIGLAVLVSIAFAVWGVVHDKLAERTGNVPLGSMADAWWHRFRKAHGMISQHRESTVDDLDDDTAALLSMLPLCPIVVDADDSVVRCGPEAYRFGLVRDDEIVDDRVLETIRAIRGTGGKTSLDITTSTRSMVPVGADDEQSVSHGYWLKATVGRLGEHFVVVLLEDVTDMVMFARTREAFIENVSEQLMKPTRQLNALARDLRDNAQNADRVIGDADAVRGMGRRMSRMVADLLLLIRAQEPIVASSANRLSLLSQARSVVDRCMPMARQRHIRLSVCGDGGLTVNGDGDQIRAAITKLVENAIAYSHEGGSVSVAVTASSDGGHAVVRVIDQGCGIPKSEQEHIFERFYRGKEQNERTGAGIGLGLAIVKHVALSHHGAASVWSSPKSGSTFSLSLPVAR